MHKPELLEPRRLFASAFANINVSRTAGNHAEGTIVVDPTDASRVFAASNAPGVGLLASVSSDGGATWSSRVIASDTTNPSEDLTPACCDPSAAFDRFGNLYLTYARDDDAGVDVVYSADAGDTFSTLATFHGRLDQPTITTGPDAVWATFKQGSAVAAAGAGVTGKGKTSVGSFTKPVLIPGSRSGNFGDIAVGPAGQVAVTYQQGTRLSVSVDPDGLGPARFGKKVLAAAPKVSGFDRIVAQRSRGIDAEAGLAYDRTGGPFSGRLYFVYTDEQPDASDNTDIYLRYSPDDGRTWSAPARVNSDSGLASQFMPRMVVDDSGGDLGFCWYDTRNDTGAGSPGDTNGVAGDDAEFFVARARPATNGMLIGTDAPVSQGSNNADAAGNSIDLGDYTGLAFHNGLMLPLWADNSNSTGDNPDGRLNQLDQYTARVPAAALPQPTQLVLGNLPGTELSLASPQRGGPLGGRSEYRIRVTYASPAGVDDATIDDTDLLVLGPASYAERATLLSVRNGRGGARVATYSAPAPGGRWVSSANGVYRILLQTGAVRDGAGTVFDAGVIGYFAVRTGLGA